ncbi:MAG: lactate utilization protein LutB domain-containing protein, partial [Bryobacteraceae bacterium]
RLLLELRHEVVQARAREGQNRWERLAFKVWAWVMSHPRVYEMASLAAGLLASEEAGQTWIRRAPALLNAGPLRAWLDYRDLPAPGRSFRMLWRERTARVRE